MDKKIKAAIGVVVFVVIMAVSVLAYNLLKDKGGAQSFETRTTVVNNKGENTSKTTGAPDFSARNDSGEIVHFSSFLGKPTVISFWATWCPNCKEAMPAFQKIYNEMGSNVNIVMVNVTDGARETETKARAYMKEKGYNFSVLYDIKQEAANKFGIRSIPDTYFIDASGNVVTRGSGALNEELIKKGIKMITE